MRSELYGLRTGAEPGVFDITDRCDSFVSGLGDGLLNVFVPHATAGVAILEVGAGSDVDLLMVLERMLPDGMNYQHRHGSKGHGRDHVLPAIVSPSATVPVVAGRLTLGTWQSICVVDTNVDNADRQFRLTFVAG